MKNLAWVIPLLFCGTLDAQIYQGSTIYGSKVSRFKPELVLHIPTSSDTLIRTIDPSPQIRIINGVLKLWLNNRWNDITSGSVSGGTGGTGTVPAWGSITGYLPDQTDLAAALASKASVSTLSQYLLNATAQATYATIGALDTLKNTPYNLRIDRTLRVVSGDTVLGVNTDTIPTKLWVLANIGSGGGTSTDTTNLHKQDSLLNGALIQSISITGTTTKTVTLTRRDGIVITGTFNDLQGSGTGNTVSSNYTLPYNGSSVSYLGGDTILHLLPTIPTTTSQLVNNSGFITNITGYVTAGTNVSVTGSGTSGSPYVINSTATGGTIQTTSYQTQTSTAGQKIFTFTNVPSSLDDFWIDINSMVAPQSIYSKSGNVITFTSGMVAGDVIGYHQVK